MADRGLTPKQQRFVAEYLTDLNATQAAIRTGYSKKTAKEQASRLLTNVNVRAAVDAAQAKLSGKLEITAEKVLRDIEDTRRNAVATMEWGPALKASELQGKHIGMFADKHLHGGLDGGPIRMLGDIDRAARIAGLLGKAVKRKDGAET